ncbi:hypothetical protein [Frigoriglobus tundricola]|uniref:Glycosyltransferase RgtA/B/C/D-like domain-containing protein n=1 Tax=Frigoriglobus tundricola TaxID=2774151 RepID=A0A6M5YI87_9BACT|nr:hypothetical protein [Frigoriglobus tundricola]QJW93698.1 hypothetical protein FTUN_1206 [Frigoriglobus tundricola]
MSAVACEAPSRPVSPGAAGLQPGVATFVWGAWAVMLVLTLVYVGKFGSRLPYYDDWDVVPVLTGAEPLTLAYLWEPYHSHCMPLPKLALVSLTRLSSLDFRVAKFFHVALFGALAAALLLTVRRQRGHHEFADVFLPLFVLGLAQWECYLLPSCINLIFTSVIAGTYLVLLANGGPRVSGRRAVVMAGCLALLPLCSAAGLALVPALTLWLAPVGIFHCRAADAPVRRQGWLVLALIAVALVLSGLSVLSLRQPGQGPAPHEPAKVLACARQVLNMLFGAPVPPFATRTAAVVLLLLAASGTAWLAAWWRQPGERLALLGFLAFSLGMGCLVGGIALGRVDYLATAVYIPRYATLQLPLGCCLYVFWGRYGGRCAPAAQMALLLVAAVTFAPNLRDAWESGDSRRQALRTFEADLNSGLSPAQLAERGAGHVYWAEGKDDFARYLLMWHERHPAAYGLSHPSDASGRARATRTTAATRGPVAGGGADRALRTSVQSDR